MYNAAILYPHFARVLARHPLNACLMLAHRLRRWLSIKQALGGSLEFAGVFKKRWEDRGQMVNLFAPKPNFEPGRQTMIYHKQITWESQKTPVQILSDKC